MIIKYNVELNDAFHPLMVEETRLPYSEEKLNSPGKIADMLNSLFRLDRQAEEKVFMVCLNRLLAPVGVFEVSHGTAGMAPLAGREVLLRAVLCSGASSFVLAHNHPSGSTDPSEEDKMVAGRLKDAADLIGIPMNDFLIVSRADCFSFAKAEML